MKLDNIVENVVEWVKRPNHKLYFRIGRLIERDGFDGVVSNPKLRKFAKRYAQNHGLTEKYNTAFIRYVTNLSE